jgi:hypothetical protein
MKDEKLRLRDPDIFPSTEVLAEVFGDSYGAYEVFRDALAGLDIELEWKYYPSPMCGKCWLAQGKYRYITPRGANKDKTIFWFSAWDGYFNVAIWFKEINRDEILRADVSDETKKLIRNAKLFSQKMRTFPLEFEVRTAEQLADIYTLIRYKKRLEA